MEHYEELRDVVSLLDLENHVTFLRSVSDVLKQSLLKRCDCLVYTPENEHFGIVPVEAMYCKCPVIAANSGGPLETIVHEKTGFLCAPTADQFAEHMLKICREPSLAKNLGANGHERVVSHFSFQTFTVKLNTIVSTTLNK